MKKMVWMAFVAVMMMLGVESMAQPVQRGEWRRGMTPEQMAERQTMRLSKELALSKKQADKIYKLQLKQLRRMMAMRGRMQAVKGHREPMPSEMLKARRERTEAYRKILSPMQFAKWQQLEQSYAKKHRPQMHQGVRPSAKKGGAMGGHRPHAGKKDGKRW